MKPAPPPIGTAARMHGVSPAMMYRITSIGIAGTPMASFSGTLTPEQRWNVVAYVNSLRTTRAQELEGEGLYTQRCASCHGVTGAGDGAYARSLTKLPPEIGSVSWQMEHSDEDIASVVLNGIPGSAMPPARDLSPAEAASLVAYVRTLPSRDRSLTDVASADTLGAHAAARTVIAQLEQALSFARSGRFGDAGDKAFDAYIAFEPLEGPARAKNPGLVSSMERQFADFKAAVRNNDLRGA